MKRLKRSMNVLVALVIGCSIVLGWIAIRTPSPPAPTLPAARPMQSQPDPETRARVESALGKLPLYFIENRGQDDAQVAYYVPGKDTTVYFTAKGLTFALTSPTPTPPPPFRRSPAPLDRT